MRAIEVLGAFSSGFEILQYYSGEAWEDVIGPAAPPEEVYALFKNGRRLPLSLFFSIRGTCLLAAIINPFSFARLLRAKNKYLELWYK